jgi:hypothetical protein
VIQSWQQGRAEIDEYLQLGLLQRVQPDRRIAEYYLSQARSHLLAAKCTLEVDPLASFQTAYDAGRKALAAILENQGLRATSKGGHRIIEDALRAQLVPPLGALVRDFGWMRILRNASEYPSFDRPVADTDDATKAHAIVAQFIASAEKLLDEIPVY